MFISSNTKYLREKKGLTQDELATLVGVTQNAIYKVENGITLNPRFVVDLASALEVEPEALKNTDLRSAPTNKIAANIQSPYPINTPVLSPELEALFVALLNKEQEGNLPKKLIEALANLITDKIG